MNIPAKRTSEQLILEGLVTTTNEDGSVNVAPMGPVTDPSVHALRLRPFATSLTFQNLRRTGCGVFHITDDSLLLATAALGQPEPFPELRKLERMDAYIISDACRWFAFEVDNIDTSKSRVEMECRIVERGEARPFLGWNRAMHGVLEAAILATRVGILPDHEIRTQLDAWRLVVEKTASDRERMAFQHIENYVAQQ